MGCGTGDDVSALFGETQEPPSQPTSYRQGTLLTFDPDTLENTVDVGGTILVNLPILGSADRTVMVPNATVGVMPVGSAVKTMYLFGRPMTSTTGDPGGRTVDAHSFCTASTPVKLCMTDRRLERDEYNTVWAYAPNEDTDGGRYLVASLRWTCPGDPVDEFPFVGDDDLVMQIVGGVAAPGGYIYEDGTREATYGRGYGLPQDEDHGAVVDTTDDLSNPHRFLFVGLRRDVGRDFDGFDNVVYGQSRMHLRFDEISNIVELYVERPGIETMGSGDYFPARNTVYQFQPEGLAIVGDVEPEQDPEILPPLQVNSDEGIMHVGGRSIWVFDGDDPAPITINNLVIDPDGNITTGGGLATPGTQQGTEPITFSSLTSTTVTVTFPVAFAAAPRVFPNLASSDPSTAGWTVRAVNATTTTVDLYVEGPSSSWSAIPIEWMAIAP